MSVQEVEVAITQLPTKELAELITWIEEYHALVWDKQIEADLAGGRLNELLTQVDTEYRSGLSNTL